MTAITISEDGFRLQGVEFPKGSTWARDGEDWVRPFDSSEVEYRAAEKTAQVHAARLGCRFGHDWATRFKALEPGDEVLKAWAHYCATYDGGLWSGLGPAIRHSTSTGRLRWHCWGETISFEVWRPGQVLPPNDPPSEWAPERREASRRVLACDLVSLVPVQDDRWELFVTAVTPGVVLSRHVNALEDAFNAFVDEERASKLASIVMSAAISPEFVQDVWDAFIERQRGKIPGLGRCSELARGAVMMAGLIAVLDTKRVAHGL
jgi:hypothetical protein